MPGLLDLGTRPRVLLSRTDRIGDVVLSLPVAVALRKAYPAARVDFLARNEAVPIVESQPAISEVVRYDPTADQEKFVSELVVRRYDAVICLFPRPILARTFARAGIPVRIGTARRWYSFRFTHRVKISRRTSGRHEKDLNLDLLGPLGIRPDYSLIPQLVVTLELGRAVSTDTLFSFRGQDHRPLVIIHPGDGGSAQNWSLERYTQLAGLLLQDGVDVVITGVIGERERHLEAFLKVTPAEQIMTGRTNLRQLMAILAEANLFVGGSTGPLHIAAALGTPVVGLYGPIRTTTPDRWGPCGNGHTILVPDVPICRCKVGSCKLGNCMDRVTVDHVLAACRNTLRRMMPGAGALRPNETGRVSDLTSREA